MNTDSNQDYQKNVVAFVAGLLIGGLLVWVFSTPEETTPRMEDDAHATTTETAMEDTAMKDGGAMVGAGVVAAECVCGRPGGEGHCVAGVVAQSAHASVCHGVGHVRHGRLHDGAE